MNLTLSYVSLSIAQSSRSSPSVRNDHGDPFVLCVVEQHLCTVVLTFFDGIPINRTSVFVYGIEDIDSVLGDDPVRQTERAVKGRSKRAMLRTGLRLPASMPTAVR